MWWHTGGPAGWSDGHVLILDTNDTRLPPHWAGNFETFNALWAVVGDPRSNLAGQA